jgi:hypothetical protein
VRNLCFSGIFLSALVLMGCHNEETQVRAYLERLAASSIRIQEVSKEFRLALEEVSQNSSTVQLEVSAWEAHWDRMIVRLKAEESLLENLAVPSAASGLNRAVLNQCRLLIKTVEATRPLIEVADQISQANRRSEQDPAAAEQITQEMLAVEGERKEVARVLERLNIQSVECEDEIRRQHLKLQEEFGLALRLENSPQTRDL